MIADWQFNEYNKDLNKVLNVKSDKGIKNNGRES